MNKIKNSVLTVKDACEYMRVSRATLSKYMKRGEIRYVKLAGAVRFFEGDLLKFLNSHIVA